MSKSITKADLKLIKLCDRFNKNSENLAKDMIEIGRELLAKKPTLTGGFMQYVKETLPISYETARVCMRAFDAYSEDMLPESFTVSDIYLCLKEGKQTQNVCILPENKGLTDEKEEIDNNSDPDFEPVEDEEDDWKYESEPEEIKTTEATVIDNAKVNKDRYGQEIPEQLEDVFKAVNVFNRWAKTLSTVKKDIKNQIGEFGFDKIEGRIIDARFQNIYEVLNLATPYCICPACGGDGGLGSKCGHCGGAGWMVKRVFHTLPEEYKVGLDNYEVKK